MLANTGYKVFKILGLLIWKARKPELRPPAIVAHAFFVHRGVQRHPPGDAKCATEILGDNKVRKLGAKFS